VERVILGFGYPTKFILLELPSPLRRIFIGSHSLPPSLVASSVLQVALVQSMGFNFLFVSHLLDEVFEVLFRPGGS
jgi:hypothetical protein